LAVRARSKGLVAEDVDRALGEGALLITWLNRGTLHLIRSEDYGWLHALTTPPLRRGNARRLEQEGVSERAAEKGVRTIERALGEEGPRTRAELRDRLDRAGVPTAGQALVHLLMLATLRGVAVRGPMRDGEHAYALVADWLGPQTRVDREGALAELARRYLAGHGPATDRDLARWAGLPLRDTRAGLAAIAPELEQRVELVSLSGTKSTRRLPAPALLGQFDPVLLGWSSREDVLGPHTQLVTTNGLFRPFAMVDGRAVATWRFQKGKVGIEPLERIEREAGAALDAEAADVERYLGTSETRLRTTRSPA
jgi:hypothetical protein